MNKYNMPMHTEVIALMDKLQIILHEADATGCLAAKDETFILTSIQNIKNTMTLTKTDLLLIDLVKTNTHLTAAISHCKRTFFTEWF